MVVDDEEIGGKQPGAENSGGYRTLLKSIGSALNPFNIITESEPVSISCTYMDTGN